MAAASFFVTSATAQGMLNGTALATALGASPLIKIYAGTFTPASMDADTTISSPTLLATLTMAATPFSSFAGSGSAPNVKGVATFGSVTSGTAAATGTAAYFDMTTSGGTVKARGNIGTTSESLVLNTTAITSGSTVSVTAGTISLPTGA
jgi:hypothetical protein